MKGDTKTEGMESTTTHPKVKRSRMKTLYKRIASQMDFYFGNANLRRDRFMKKEIEAAAEGYLPVELFMKFNKIKEITEKVEDIQKAIPLFSKILALDETKTKVKRTAPLPSPESEEVDKRTVYVEGIPRKVDHGWVSNEFSTYGPIAYISLAKYPSTGDLKGFAFIEFETEEASQKCLDALGTKEFSSLHPFPKVGTNDMQRMQRSLEKSEPPVTPKKKNKKRSSTSTDNNQQQEKPIENDPPKAKKLKSESEAGTGTDTAIESDTGAANGTKACDTEGPTKPNKKRKRKSSQTKTKEEQDEVKEEIKAEKIPKLTKAESKPGTKPKAESKTPSKTESKKVKQEPNSINQGKKNKPEKKMRAISKLDWMNMRKQFLKLQKAEMSELKSKMRDRKAAEEKNKQKENNIDGGVENLTKAVEDLQMMPGVIVQIKSENELEKDRIKKAMPDIVEVAYIETRVGSNTGFIRCHSCEDAQILLEKSCGENYHLELITGDEEKAYWEKLNQQREASRKAATEKKKRQSNKKGTQKLVEQTMKMNNRNKKKKKATKITFDDDDE